MTDEAPLTHGYECEDCGEKWYYTRSRCPACAGREHGTYRLGEGELLAGSVVHVTPPGVRDENRLGLATFDGVNVIAQVEGDAAVGDRVEIDGVHDLRTVDGEALSGPRLTRIG